MVGPTHGRRVLRRNVPARQVAAGPSEIGCKFPLIIRNVAAACRPCNLTKRDRTPDEAGMRLEKPCRAPRATAWVVIAVSGIPDTWRPYLPLAS